MKINYDIPPSALRSKIMSSVKSKNTGAEMVVRKVLRALGFYYRLHVKNLPGKPDIVFRKLKKIVLVNGCFWHGHSCNKGRLPKSNIAFWKDKIEKNIQRDEKTELELNLLGWKVFIVWQCQTKDIADLANKLNEFLTH